MAKKKKVNKNKKTADVNRILLLVLGSASVISILFIAGFLIDYIAIKFSRSPSPDRYSIIEENEKSNQADEKGKGTSDAKKDVFSFFETLLNKSEKKADYELETEADLRTHNRTRKAKKTVEKPENKKESKTVYAVQLGSFKGFAAARTFRDEYIKKGYRAYIVSGAVPGKGTLYRVRIGRFKIIEEAQDFSATLEEKEKVSVFITSK